MSLKLVPIKLEQLEQTRPIWYPFLVEVAKRQRCFIEQRLLELYSGAISLIIVWDDGKEEAAALLGYSLIKEGASTRMRLMLLQGKKGTSLKEVLALYETLEQWARNAGCCGASSIVRPAYGDFFRSKGYRVIHIEFEKDFEHAKPD